MKCTRCSKDLEDCTCRDPKEQNEQLRKMCDKGGVLACRWCKACDSHYSVCKCSKPDWWMRMDGKLKPIQVRTMPLVVPPGKQEMN